MSNNRSFSHANQNQKAATKEKIFIGRVEQKDFSNGSFMMVLALGPKDLAKLDEFLKAKPANTDWNKVWINFELKQSKEKGTWYAELK